MTNRDLHGLPEEFRRRLERLERRIRRFAILRGVGMVCAILGAGILLALLIDWTADLGLAVRIALLASVIVSVLVTAWRYVLRPLLRDMSAAEVAAVVDNAYPELREELAAGVELNDTSIPESYRGSALLRSLLTRNVMKTTEVVDFDSAVDPASTRKWLMIGLVTLLLVLAPLGATRTGYGVLLSRFLTPWRNHERVTNLTFHVENGDRAAARGSDVVVVAEPRWRFVPGELPESVWIEWRDAGGGSETRRMTYDAERQAYVSTFPHVLSSFDYEVAAGRSRTRQFHIDVVEAPEVTGFSLDIQPPAFTGMPAETLDGAGDRVDLFGGSQLQFRLAFSKPVSKATLELSPTRSRSSTGAATGNREEDGILRKAFTLSTDGLSGTLDLIAEQSGPFSIGLLDEHLVENQQPTTGYLEVHADHAPDIAWMEQGVDPEMPIPAMEVRMTDRIPIGVWARDDVAVAAVDLHLEVVQRGEGLPPIQVPPAELGHAEVGHTFDVDLAAYALQQGDLLAIRARAADNRPIPGPNESWTAPRMISIRSDADPLGLSELLRRQQTLRSALEALRQQVVAHRDQVTDFLQTANADRVEKRAFSKSTELTESLSRSEELTEGIDQLAEAFSAHALYRTMAEPLREIGRGPVQQAQDRLREADEAELPVQLNNFQESIAQLTEAERGLLELAERFEELAKLEQDLMDLQRLADAAKRLTSETRALEQQWEQLRRDQSLTPEQREQRAAALEEMRANLQDRQENLATALDDLLEKRPELLQAARQQQFDLLRQLAERALELSEPQDRLAEALGQEALRSSDSLAPFADRQAHLLAEAQRIDAESAPLQAEKIVSPLESDSLQRSLEALQSDQVEQALEQQERAAAELERLAEALRKNESLPADPQAAARELSRRQQALQKQLSQLTNDDEPEVTDRRRVLAAEQAALGRAIEQLPLPPRVQERQLQAAQKAQQTLQQMLDNDRTSADRSADETRRALDQIAQQVGSENQRRNRARGEVAELRGQQQQLADEVDHHVAAAQEGKRDEVPISELRERQLELAGKTAALDVPGFEAQQNSALGQQVAALTDLQQEAGPESAASQRLAEQRLLDLERALQNKPTATEELQQLQAQQQELADAVRQTEEQDTGALRSQSRRQRKLADDVSRLASAADRAQKGETQQALRETATALQQAAEGQRSREEVGQALDDASEKLQDLMESVTGKADTAAGELSQAEQQQMEDLTRLSPRRTPTSPAESASTAEQLAELADQQRQLQQALRESPLSQEHERGPTEPETPPANDAASPAEPPALADTLARQQQLAEAALQTTLKMARQLGVESPAVQQAREVAEQTDRAVEQFRSGQLSVAAQSASEAAEMARAAAEALSAESDEGPAALTDEVNELARQQADVAEQLEQMANSSACQQQARESGQRHLEQETQALTAQLEAVARNLGSAPLNEPAASESAASAQQSTTEAQAAMGSSLQQAQQGDQRQAGQQAHQAAESLRAAANLASSALPPEGLPPSPVPGEVGEQLAEAQRQLDQAGEQLAQAPETMSSSSQSTQQGEGPGEQTAQNGQTPAPGQPGTEAADGQAAPDGQEGQMAEGNRPGESSEGGNPQQGNSPASEAMQRVADALQQAAQQLGLPSPAPTSSDSAQQTASGSSQSSEGGTDGSGAKLHSAWWISRPNLAN